MEDVGFYLRFVVLTAMTTKIASCVTWRRVVW